MMAVQRCAWGRASSLGRSRRGISRQHRQMLALTHGCPAGVPFTRGLSMLAEPQESKFMPRELYTKSGLFSRSMVFNRVNSSQLMDERMLDFVSKGVEAYRKYDDEVLSITIRNSCGQMFCPGPEFSKLYPPERPFELSNLRAKAFFRKVQETAWDIADTQYPPTITIINGIAGGPGLAVGLNSKFTCGTPNTVLAITEPFNGFVPYGGSTFYYARLPRKLGFYLALTGVAVSGVDTFFADMVAFFAEENMYDQMLENLERSEYKGIQSVTAAVNEALLVNETIDPEERKGFELREHFEEIERCFTCSADDKDPLGTVIKNLELEQTEWALETKEIILKASPLAAKVTFELLRQAETSPLEHCIRMEHIAMQRMMDTHDYKTGIEAILSSTKKSETDAETPLKWNPSRFEDVTKADVDQFVVTVTDDLKEEDLRIGLVANPRLYGGEIEYNYTSTVLDEQWLREGHLEDAEAEQKAKDHLSDLKELNVSKGPDAVVDRAIEELQHKIKISFPEATLGIQRFEKKISTLEKLREEKGADIASEQVIQEAISEVDSFALAWTPLPKEYIAIPKEGTQKTSAEAVQRRGDMSVSAESILHPTDIKSQSGTGEEGLTDIGESDFEREEMMLDADEDPEEYMDEDKEDEKRF